MYSHAHYTRALVRGHRIAGIKKQYLYSEDKTRMSKDLYNIENHQPQGEIILYQPDETVRLEVRLGEDTVWLTQQQMAELFSKDRTVIGRHIRNIYREEELDEHITCAKLAHMGTEGDQNLGRKLFAIDKMGIDKSIILNQL